LNIFGHYTNILDARVFMRADNEGCCVRLWIDSIFLSIYTQRERNANKIEEFFRMDYNVLKYIHEILSIFIL